MTHFCKGSPGCQVRLPDDVEDCGRHGSPTEKDLRATVRLPSDLWLGINKWGVRGDGVLEPFCVYTLDASRAAVGFYPFGYGLPGMMEEQARALCDLLNAAAAEANSGQAG